VLDLANPGWTSEVRKITGKKGVNLVVEHIGGPVLEQLFNCLARGAVIVTCGATAGREVSINLWPLFVKQQSLVGSYSRNRADLKATLQWAAEGRLKPVIDRILPLKATAEAYHLLRSRQVLGKVLVSPVAQAAG